MQLSNLMAITPPHTSSLGAIGGWGVDLMRDGFPWPARHSSGNSGQQTAPGIMHNSPASTSCP